MRVKLQDLVARRNDEYLCNRKIAKPHNRIIKQDLVKLFCITEHTKYSKVRNILQYAINRTFKYYSNTCSLTQFKKKLTP